MAVIFHVPLSPSERVWAAYQQMSDAELLQLRRCAKRWVWALGERRGGRTWEDLLHEAVALLAEGRRNWPTDQTLNAIVRLTIRTIAIDISREGLGAHGRSPEQPLDCSFVRYQQVTTMNPEVVAQGNEFFMNCSKLFPPQAVEQMVLKNWMLGLSGSEIRGELHLSRMEFDKVTKRIRRRVRAAFGGRS